jgi:glycosyltransferase involved in cell wall biosynthesis
MTPVFWFDITTLTHWKRPPVGIVRVEMECAIYAQTFLQGKVRFCRYAEGRYAQVSSEELSRILQSLHRSTETGHSIDSPAGRTSQNTKITGKIFDGADISFYGRAARITRALLRKLPETAGDRTLRYLQDRKEAVLAGIDGLRELRRAWRLWRRPTSFVRSLPAPAKPARRASLFQRGDVYISLGLDWQYKDPSFIMEQKLTYQLKILLMCYDIIPIKFPQYCLNDTASYFIHYFSDIAWCADMILCISQCTERDCINFLNNIGAPIPKTHVVQLGTISMDKDAGHQHKICEIAGTRFIVYVSTIERRKNHETLYKAYSRLLDEGHDDLPKLICVGMKGWGITELLSDLTLDPRVKEYIIILDNVDDEELSWLYKHCLYTVFPSLYEGWGLAVAESLAAGKFCLSSNKGSLPEVGGDFVEYIDPWDVPLWAERIAYYAKNTDQLRIAEKYITENYKLRAWSETSRAIFEQAELLCKQ